MHLKMFTFLLVLLGTGGSLSAQPVAPDPRNPVHCEAALQVAGIAAREFAPANAPEIQRVATLASQEVAARIDPKEAEEVRKSVWPLLGDKRILHQLAVACHARLAGDGRAADEGTSFEAAVQQYGNCMKAMVQLGMRLKMPSEQFRTGFATKCLDEEARFRAVAIQEAMRQGRTEDQARSEINGNIARAREVYAADQASYVRTGRVPK